MRCRRWVITPPTRDDPNLRHQTIEPFLPHSGFVQQAISHVIGTRADTAHLALSQTRRLINRPLYGRSRTASNPADHPIG